MKRLQPESKESPRPDNVVVVDSLTPAIGLMCMQPVDGYAAGTIRPVYGGYLSNDGKTEMVYSNGSTPKDWRISVEEEGYENETLLIRLPDLIQEIDLKQCPEYKLVLTDCKIVPMPTHTEPEAPLCRMIEHPAVKLAKVQPIVRKPPHNGNTANKPGPNQIYFYPPAEINNEPYTEKLA